MFLLLTGKTCPLYAAPKNGALACNTIASDIICVAMCRNGFDFEFNPPMLYFCVDGEWVFYNPLSYPSPRQLPWPDCSSKLISSIITVRQRRRPHASGYFYLFFFILRYTTKACYYGYFGFEGLGLISDNDFLLLCRSHISLSAAFRTACSSNHKTK